MNENNTIVLYQDEDGITRVDVRFSGEDVWLTRDQIAQLYSTTPQNLSLHIGNIYADQELEENPTRKKFFLVRQEGTRNARREIDHYNLDMVIALGYRVQSQVATRFRRWATQIVSLRRSLLEGSGAISHEEAIAKAEHEFLIYREREMRTLESDFDKAIKQLKLFEDNQ